MHDLCSELEGKIHNLDRWTPTAKTLDAYGRGRVGGRKVERRTTLEPVTVIQPVIVSRAATFKPAPVLGRIETPLSVRPGRERKLEREPSPRTPELNETGRSRPQLTCIGPTLSETAGDQGLEVSNAGLGEASSADSSSVRGLEASWGGGMGQLP